MTPLVIALMLAQPPPAAQTSPTEVCLTNACAEAPSLPRPATVREAVAVGDARRARELGGTPIEVVDALKEEIRRTNPNRERAQADIDRLTAFADVSNGARLAFQDGHTGTEMKVSATGAPAGVLNWGIDRTNPDGTVQSIALLPQGGVFIGAPHRPD